MDGIDDKIFKNKVIELMKERNKKDEKSGCLTEKKRYKVAIFDDYNIRANHFHAVHQGTQSWRESSI